MKNLAMLLRNASVWESFSHRLLKLNQQTEAINLAGKIVNQSLTSGVREYLVSILEAMLFQQIRLSITQPQPTEGD